MDDGLIDQQVLEHLAARGDRSLASLADAFITAVLLIPAAIAFMDGEPDDSATMLQVGMGLGGAVTLLNFYLLSVRGQTLGMAILGIRVVRMDGGQAGFLRAVVLRIWLTSVLLFGAGWLGPWYEAGFLLADLACITGPSRRCLHDYLAGTKVVYVW